MQCEGFSLRTNKVFGEPHRHIRRWRCTCRHTKTCKQSLSISAALKQTSAVSNQAGFPHVSSSNTQTKVFPNATMPVTYISKCVQPGVSFCYQMFTITDGRIPFQTDIALCKVRKHKVHTLTPLIHSAMTREAFPVSPEDNV